MTTYSSAKIGCYRNGCCGWRGQTSRKPSLQLLEAGVGFTLSIAAAVIAVVVNEPAFQLLFGSVLLASYAAIRIGTEREALVQNT